LRWQSLPLARQRAVVGGPAVLPAWRRSTHVAHALLCLAAVALIPLLLGYGEAALALTPALIAGLIADCARCRGRRPLIAR
jgi:hypothetical protein